MRITLTVFKLSQYSEAFFLLGYGTAHLGVFFIGHLALENETIMLSQNIRHRSPSDTAPYPRRMKTSYGTGFHEMSDSKIL